MRKTQARTDIVPQYEPVDSWCARSGMSRDGTYKALGRGDLRAIKLGRRTLIHVQPGLAWLESLPRAEFRQKPDRAA